MFNMLMLLTIIGRSPVQLVKKKLFINSLNGKLFAFDVKPCSNHSKQKV